MSDSTQINGTVADGFGPVADAFARNFTEHGELGAAFSLYVAGEMKADLWGGIADKQTGRPWTDDTLQLVYSTTKGAAAICVARLVAAGRITYADTVATHWPEFAANGKGDITIAQMMSHQAGLPYSRAVHATEMPAANGITTARSLARMYAGTVGDVDGVRLFGDDTVAAVRAEAVKGSDACLTFETRFGMGFMLDGEFSPMLSPGSFGHPGAGGSLGYADPEAKVGYGYVMNQMAGGLAGDPRTIGLNDAVRACL